MYENTFEGDSYIHHLGYGDGFMSACIDQCVRFIVWELYLNKGIKNRRRKEEKERLGQKAKGREKWKENKRKKGKFEENIPFGLRVNVN